MPHPVLGSLVLWSPLPLPLQVPFDIFDRHHRESWNIAMTRFRKSVEEIEHMTKSFIKQSFQKLRSAEGAFELVQVSGEKWDMSLPMSYERH